MPTKVALSRLEGGGVAVESSLPSLEARSRLEGGGGEEAKEAERIEPAVVERGLA